MKVGRVEGTVTGRYILIFDEIHVVSVDIDRYI